MTDLKRMFGPTTRDRIAEFFGREPHPSANGRQVYHLRSASGFSFEWHPRTRKVYLVRTDHKPVVAEVMAFDIETHGDAVNAINIWLRGYHEGQLPGVLKPNLAADINGG